MARKPAAANALPATLSEEIATTRDGRDITQPWVADLQQPRDPRLMSSVDWGIYDKIFMDDQVKSCLEQRFSAVVSAEWDVLPGDDKDAKSISAADAFKEMLGKIGLDRITKKMLFAIYHGYSVGEIGWKPIDGLIGFDWIKVRHARRFRYDKDANLRLLTRSAPRGELLPDRKFWVVTSGASHDDDLYGHGLADWLYWPTLFKRNGIRFWNIFLDKFGTPTTVAKYRRGTPKADIAKLIAALQALATDSGVAVPEGTAIELLQAVKSGAGDFDKIARYMDEAIAKVILSQTMTTQDGSSLSQAKVHAGVKLEIVKADADLLSDSFNDGPAKWWCELNYGSDVAPPQLVRLVEEEADLKVMAETDAILKQSGWERTDDSFRDAYGDGYERKTPVDDEGETTGKADADAPVADEDFANLIEKRVASFAAADPKPLYVHRRLKNARDLIAWAKKQGFTSTLPAGEIHVTIAYSKRPVNWFAIDGIWNGGDLLVPEGGARAVEPLGNKGAVVLHFSNSELTWRHGQIIEAGASWDHQGYQPHVTITYDGAPADLEAVEPYRGKLVFGPEIFEAIEDDWQEGIRELRFAEPGPGDIVDEAVTALLEEHGYTPLTPAMQRVISALESASTAADFDRALLEALPPSDADALAPILAKAGFAIRIAAEAGDDG